MKALWILYFLGQFLSYGNMNYQQEIGYYEINPVYVEHPSSREILVTKLTETAILYGFTKAYPKYEREVMTGANMFVWGFIVYDRFEGIKFGLRF